MDFVENKDNGWVLPQKTLMSDLSVVDNELEKATQELTSIRMRRNYLLRNLVGRTYVDVVSKVMSQKTYIKVTEITNDGRIVVRKISEPCDNPKQGSDSGETTIPIDDITNPMLWEEIPNEDFDSAVQKMVDELHNVVLIKPTEYVPLPEINVL